MLGQGQSLVGGKVDGNRYMNRLPGLRFIKPDQMLITAFFSSCCRIGRMKSSISNAPADVT